MILTLMVTRTAAQHVRATLRAWTPTLGTYDICFAQWDPHGPLSSREAAIDAMGRVCAALVRDGHPVAGRGWLDALRDTYRERQDEPEQLELP